MLANQLLQKYPIISDQITSTELHVLLIELERVLQNNVAGDVVEFGCFVGTSSLFFRRLLDSFQVPSFEKTKALHVYDSFAGLPEKDTQDESPLGTQFVAGELLASKSQLIKNFGNANLKMPYIHKGWFSDLTPKDIPSKICFAFLDGDYYKSIADPLHLIKGNMAPGSVIIIDDYANQALPGAAKATNQWAARHNLNIQVQASLAIIRL